MQLVVKNGLEKRKDSVRIYRDDGCRNENSEKSLQVFLRFK